MFNFILLGLISDVNHVFIYGPSKHASGIGNSYDVNSMVHMSIFAKFSHSILKFTLRAFSDTGNPHIIMKTESYDVILRRFLIQFFHRTVKLCMLGF